MLLKESKIPQSSKANFTLTPKKIMRTDRLMFTIFACVAAVKPIVVDVVYGWLAGSMKQLPLIVRVAVFIIHGLLFDLVVPP